MRVFNCLADCQLVAAEGFPSHQHTCASKAYTHLGTSQVHWRREIVLLRRYLGPGLEAQLHSLDVATMDSRMERHIALRVVEGYHLLAGAAALLAPLENE